MKYKAFFLELDVFTVCYKLAMGLLGFIGSLSCVELFISKNFS